MRTITLFVNYFAFILITFARIITHSYADDRWDLNSFLSPHRWLHSRSKINTSTMTSIRVPQQKVILCGEYGVGKSSVFRRFAFNLFIPSNSKQSTLGLDHYNKEYSVGEKAIKVCTTLQICVFLLNNSCELDYGIFSYSFGTLVEWNE